MAIVTGVWERKHIERPDQQTVERVKALIGRHPYTICNAPELAAEYAELYTQDELQVLKASLPTRRYNMVQSYTKEWVQDGVWVPPAAKPDEQLKPGYQWQDTPFGRRQVPVGQATVQPQAAVAELTDGIRAELSAIVYEAVSQALKAWSAE